MTSHPTHPLPDAAAAFVAATWLGMLIGVSFLATPVKFTAVSLDLPVALEVGHVTFVAFSRVEWMLSLLLVPTVAFSRTLRAEAVFVVIAVLIVAVQALWLLPVLDTRIEAVIAGQPMPPSMHHMLYAALEVAKAVALAAVALVALFRLAGRGNAAAVGSSL